MRNGKTPQQLPLLPPPSRLLSTTRTPNPLPSPKPPPNHHPLSHLLLVASVTKTLLRNPNRGNIPPPLSDPILLSLLRRPHLPPPLKLRLLHLSLPNFTPSPSSFSSLLLSLSSSHSSHPHILPTLQLFFSLHSSSPLPSSTLRLSLSSLLRSRLFDHALLFLHSLNHHHPNPTTLTLHTPLLLCLLRSPDPHHLSLALSLLLSLLPHYPTPHLLPCNHTLLALRRAGLRHHFRHLFDELRLRGFPFDPHGYNLSIHALASWGDFPAALALFRHMKAHSSPDLCTYNSLLSALCAAGKLPDAIHVYSELKSSGHRPDIFTYRTLVHACCRAFKIDDACGFFEEMEDRNVRPDTVIYNCLLDGLLKARRLEEACGLFERMVTDGVRPSCYSYNILIDGLFRNGRREAAYALFHNLKKGENVDGVSYGIVVVQLCREGLIEEALGLVEEMEARGFAVDLVTVTTVLIALHRRRRWGRAERLLKCVRRGTMVPDVLRWRDDMEAMLKAPQDKGKDFTPMFPSTGGFSDVLSWIGPSTGSNKDGNVDGGDAGSQDVWSLTPYLDQLAEKSELLADVRTFSVRKGKRVQGKNGRSFNVDMMNTYLSIFLRKGKLSVACKLFEIFTGMGNEPVAYSYNSLLTSFIKRGYFNQAWGVLQQMGRDVCPADIATYNVIIQALGKTGNADLAGVVMNQLVKKGGYLDIVMYNTLIHVLGKGGRLDEANKLFEQMIKSGINPDVVTFNTLIKVHAKAGRVEDAYQYLRKMLGHGCSPNNVTDTILDFLEKEIEKLRHQRASQ